MPAVPRRALLALGASAVVTAGLSVSGPSAAGPRGVLRLAAGPEGGPYRTFGQRLAEEVHRAHPGLTVEVLSTPASVRNLRLIGTGGAELGLALADSAADAVAGRAGFARPVAVAALARLYLNHLHLVVPAGSPVLAMSQLAGLRVSLGAEESGTSVVAERALAASGVPVEARLLGTAESVAALRAGELDAFFWSGGVPTPAIAELAARTPVRLVPLEAVAALLRRAYGPVYESVSIPAGSYRQPAPTPTVGTPSYLLAAAGLDDEVVRAVTEVLFRRRDDLLAPDAPGSRLDERYAIGTGSVPLHPGAVAYYRSVY
ncbi:TAXI family TRAP transporter solute-binding subunit [Kitasatospora sp. NPDC096147]|uniref:TAXI family TRAP transporter solute-binding subunit n=1 Tax=Kitasatospora sp. NPDC096147 TaxID=3364093 RepID=UPI0037FCD199